MVSAALLMVTFASIIFQDNFNDGNADGWTEVNSSDYTVENSQYHFSGGGAINDATSYRGDLGGTMSTEDYSLAFDVSIDVGSYGGCMVRYREDGPYNLLLVLGMTQQALILYRWHWSYIELLDSTPMTIEKDAWYTVRFQCNENTYTGRAWETGSTEPDEWMVWSQDTLSAPGAAALFAAGVYKGEAKIYMSCWYDNVLVESPEPWDLQPFTWAAIKAGF